MSTSALFPVVFLAHGGGPMPLLRHPSQLALIDSWGAIRRQYFDFGPSRPAPEAVLVVSAHYQRPVASVGGAARPKMIYDYGGFPPETYTVQYPAPGHPGVAAAAAEVLKAAGIEHRVEPDYGYDHGVFIPMMHLVPNADVPVVVVSVYVDDAPDAHVQLGRALAPLRSRVLILGSGSSSHHDSYMGTSEPGAGNTFNAHLTAVLADTSITADERLRRLTAYHQFPGVEEAQAPGASEHFSPLLVCAGAALGATATEISNVKMNRWNERQYVW